MSNAITLEDLVADVRGHMLEAVEEVIQWFVENGTAVKTGGALGVLSENAKPNVWCWKLTLYPGEEPPSDG